MLFPRARVAVLIDGCFWHGCPVHFTLPAKNVEYWDEKIKRNTTRDLETTRTLEERGWCVLRFWEHEPPDVVAACIVESVRVNRGSTRR